MASNSSNQITIPAKGGTPVEIRIEAQPALIAFDLSEAETPTAARVKIVVDIGNSEPGSRNYNRIKALLVGRYDGELTRDSLLGRLTDSLNKKYAHPEADKKAVRLQILHEQEPGSLSFNINLFPIPAGADNAGFITAVRRTFNEIKEKMSPKPAR